MKRPSRKKPLRPSTVMVSRSSFIDVAGDSHTHYGDVNNLYEISECTHAGIQLRLYYSKGFQTHREQLAFPGQ